MSQLSLWQPGGRPEVELVRSEPPPAAIAPAPAPSVDDKAAARVLAAWLEAELGRAVRVTLTQNRSTLLSYREDGAGLRVRVHRALRGANEAELAALATYLRGSPRGAVKHAAQVLDAFFARLAPRGPIAETECRPLGRFHDLTEIWSELNAAYFHGASTARITWGTASGKRYRRTIQLGCWVAELRLIRIHPSLDQAFVPRHYVAAVVFHEMLHEVFGVTQKSGRRCVHPPEMLAIEQSHPDHLRSKAWERQHLHRLLRYRA